MRLKLVAVAVAALVPVVAMLAYNEVAVRHQRNEEVRANAARAARQASSEIERIVEGLHSLLTTVSAMPSVRGLDKEACNEALVSVASNVPNIGSIFVVGLDGKLICGSMQPRGELNFADRDYFHQVLDTKAFVIGTYTKSKFSGAAVLPVALPLMRDGIVVAVVTTGVRLDWLQDRIADRDVANGDALTVADGNGTILARVPYPERFVGTAIPNAYNRLIHSDQPGVMEVKSQDGTERILGYRPIKLPSTPLYISAGFSRDVAFAPINKATAINSVSIAVGALLALAVSTFIGNRFIGRPVSHIADVMERWRAGDQNARTGMHVGRDDLATVGATLDKLLDELEERRRQTEKVEAERLLMARELTHRIKNSFTLVQAIARRTFQQSDPELSSSFSHRLSALAASYDLLVEREAQAATLRQAIENVLPAHQGPENKVTISGPDVMLHADLVLALSLVVHELCTNATKYGALKEDAGLVEIAWRTAERRVILSWREEHGPPVEAPRSSGFGSVLIKRAFPAWSHPEADFDFKKDGLIFTLAFDTAAPET